MRVLEDGKPWTTQVHCTGKGNPNEGCGALLEVEREDMRFFSGTDYPVYRPEAVVIRCAQYQALTDLEHDDWPKAETRLAAFTEAWGRGEEQPHD